MKVKPGSRNPWQVEPTSDGWWMDTQTGEWQNWTEQLFTILSTELTSLAMDCIVLNKYTNNLAIF